MTTGLSPEEVSSLRWRITTLLRPRRHEFWRHYRNGSPGAPQAIKVCDRNGYDFAVLLWQTCAACRQGFLAKIRVTDEWQRRGFGTRMVMQAMRGCADYEWTTTPQSDDARAFFPAMRELTQASFTVVDRPCEHLEDPPYEERRPRLITPPPLANSRVDAD